jgi:hypothetical protein
LLGRGRSPAHAERKGEGEEWATLGPEERGRGNGPELSRSISSLFLFPEFHTKLLERNSNSKIISKELYHHKFNTKANSFHAYHLTNSICVKIIPRGCVVYRKILKVQIYFVVFKTWQKFGVLQ